MVLTTGSCLCVTKSSRKLLKRRINGKFVTNPILARGATHKPLTGRLVGPEKCVLMHYKDTGQ